MKNVESVLERASEADLAWLAGDFGDAWSARFLSPRARYHLAPINHRDDRTCQERASKTISFCPFSPLIRWLRFSFSHTVIQLSAWYRRESFARGNVSAIPRFRWCCNFAITLSSLREFRFEKDYTDWSIADAFTHANRSVWAFSIWANSTNLWSALTLSRHVYIGEIERYSVEFSSRSVSGAFEFYSCENLGLCGGMIKN